MKTSTVMLIGGAIALAYFLFLRPAARQSGAPAPAGTGGTSLTVQAGFNRIWN